MACSVTLDLFINERVYMYLSHISVLSFCDIFALQESVVFETLEHVLRNEALHGVLPYIVDKWLQI